MGYVAKGIQDFLGATPSAQDMESADVLMESDQLLQASREVETAVHEDTPYQSRASSVFTARQDQQTRSASSSPSLRRTDKDDEEQFGGIPIPEEGDGYGMTDDDDDSDELDLTVLRMTPEDLIDALQRGRRVRGRDGLLDPDVVVPAMQKLIADRKARLRKDHTPEVRSVLECQRTGTLLVVLHPRGSWVRFRQGNVFLASVGHQPLAGIVISNAMKRHLRDTRVITHGGDHGASPPTSKDLLSAPFVNRRPRTLLTEPRSVRWYEGALRQRHIATGRSMSGMTIVRRFFKDSTQL